MTGLDGARLGARAAGESGVRRLDVLDSNGMRTPAVRARPEEESMQAAPIIREARPAMSVRRKVAAYFALTKPRVIELLLVVTAPTMILASNGLPDLWLLIATLIGGASEVLNFEKSFTPK